MTEAVKSPIEMFYHWEKETPDQVFLRQPSNLEWTEYTWTEVADQVRRIASFLKSKNYEPGSRIAIWSSNSKDWPICDLAISLAGHISVPIYPGQDTGSANYIFNHSEVKLVFTGAFDKAAHVKEALVDGMETVAILGCTIDADYDIEDILKNNEPYTESPIPDPEDVFTLIYTSGTTGNPKGVMHMHQTPGHVVPGLVKAFRLDSGDNRLFSFLPMSHAAERIIVEMVGIYGNIPISFSEGLATFAAEIGSVQPTFFFAVPRLWVKFKEGIDAAIPPAAQAGLSEEQKIGYRPKAWAEQSEDDSDRLCPLPARCAGLVYEDGHPPARRLWHDRELCPWHGLGQRRSSPCRAALASPWTTAYRCAYPMPGKSSSRVRA